MRLLRSVFFYIILVLSTIILGGSIVIVSFVREAWTPLIACLWGNVNLWAAGVKVNVTGLENINNRGPYIFVSNHQGWFDIFAALGMLPLRFSWLAKQELFKLPVLGAAMRRAGYIPIDRKDTRKALIGLKRAAEQIRQGTSVFIFPEGTRSSDGVIGDFKKGWFVLAAKSQQPVVPVSISGSYHILPKKCWTLHPGEIRFSIGAPIQTAGCDSKDRDLLMEQIREAIRANLTFEEAGGGGRVEPEIRGADLHDGGNICRDA
jgi:1-acyl-sn-glycerol-3-phosphate acyltransferase